MGSLDSEVKRSSSSSLDARDVSVSRVDELNENIQEHFDVYGNILVQTVDLARAHYFLKYASLAKVNVLLSGLTGSSKSFLLDSFIGGLGNSFFKRKLEKFHSFLLSIHRLQ